jgi:hypothetical protein
MTKLIIWVSGRPSLNGYRIREFIWSESHKRFIYEGKEFAPEEFNAKFEKAFQNNQDLMPRAMVASVGPVSQVVVKTTPPPSPAAPRVFTLDEALEIVQRDAPERLKKKPGPKTEVMEVA